MGQRPIVKFRPDLERFEQKRLPSAGALTAHAHVAPRKDDAAADAPPAVDTSGNVGGAPVSSPYELFRITDTGYSTATRLTPPFQQVLVQSARPVPGQTYSLMAIAVRNGTHKTFTAADGVKVRLSSTLGAIPRAFPVLTGDQTWKPGQFIVFYVLTKHYYPLSAQISAGFSFNIIPGAVIIPGPSSIQQHVVYNPRTFSKVLDFYVAYGQGPELGTGAEFGLPDTAIWEFIHKGQYIGRNAPRGSG